MQRGSLLALLPLCACAKTTFGRVVTEVTVSPVDPSMLVIKSCNLVASKSTVEQVKLDDCKRIGVRRSAVTPVPVTDAAVPHRDGRFVTGFFERAGGGATVATCRITTDRSANKWQLVDCAEVAVSTAAHDGAAAPSTAPGATP